MEDNLIAQGLRDGDPAAVAALVERHGERLFRSACLLCGQPADARDLVQETLLRAMRAAPRFQGRSALYTWLHGILLNVARTHWRRSARWLLTDREPRGEDAAEGAGSGAPARDAACAALEKALGDLSPAHREAVVLHYYDRLPIEEIAARTRTGAGTVKSRLHYARQHLRKLLGNALNPDGVGDTDR